MTIESVLLQSNPNFEIIVSDNCSTDGSLKIASRLLKGKDHKLVQNLTNIGFARNLDKAARNAKGRYLLTLSSDDLLSPDFLSSIKLLAEQYPNNDTVFSTTQNIIDSRGTLTGTSSIDWKLWRSASRDETASKLIGADVWALPAPVLLGHSLDLLRSPFCFASTTFPRALYEAVEGYHHTSLINPDKRFAWSLLSVAKHAVVVDKPLVSYRIHGTNQNSLQAKTQTLKHLVDEYIATFEISTSLLDIAKRSRDTLERTFIQQDIVLRGLVAVAASNRALAKRHLSFGNATYPTLMRKSPGSYLLRFLILLGPVGTLLARSLMNQTKKIWQERCMTKPTQTTH